MAEPLEVIVKPRADTRDLVTDIMKATQQAGGLVRKVTIDYGGPAAAAAKKPADPLGGIGSALMGIASKIIAPLFLIMQILQSSFVLQKSLSMTLTLIQMILRPVGDAIGGIILAVFRALYPLVKMLNLMWLPHQQKIMQAVGAMGKQGGAAGLANVIGVVAQEGSAFIAQLFAVSVGENAKLINDAFFTGVEMLILIVGKLGDMMAQAFDFMTGGALHLQAQWDSLIINMVLGVENAKKSTDLFIDRSVKAFVAAMSGVDTSAQDAAGNLDIFQQIVMATAKVLDYPIASIGQLKTGFEDINVGFSAMQLAINGPNAGVLAALDKFVGEKGLGGLGAAIAVYGTFTGQAADSTDELTAALVNFIDNVQRKQGLLNSGLSPQDAWSINNQMGGRTNSGVFLERGAPGSSNSALPSTLEGIKNLLSDMNSALRAPLAADLKFVFNTTRDPKEIQKVINEALRRYGIATPSSG